MDQENLVCFDNQLLDHIRFHRDGEAKAMLSEGLARATDGSTTLLHFAAFYGNHVIVRHLLELGSDVDPLQENSKETPLMIAIEQGHRGTIGALLNAKADIFVVAANGKSALQMIFDPEHFDPRVLEAFFHKLKAATSSNEQLVERLLETGCTLFHVVYSRDIHLMEHMWSRGFDLFSRGPRGMTALHVAVEINELELVRWLTEKGADVDAINDERKSPLFLAASHGRTEMVQILLDGGAIPKIEDFER